MTTGKWAQPGVPHKGWACISITDLGEPAHTCEMCEVMVVRYVHAMQHPDYPDVLEVGCVCAGNMEEDPLMARRREHSLKLQQQRRSRWLTREWQTSAKGNEYLNTADGFNITVFACGSDEEWSARVTDRTTGVCRKSQLLYPSSNEAKLAAFRAMLAMKPKRAAP